MCEDGYERCEFLGFELLGSAGKITKQCLVVEQKDFASAVKLIDGNKISFESVSPNVLVFDLEYDCEDALAVLNSEKIKTIKAIL